ncbi:transposase family protein [Nonomuraea sp. NPDC049400]|uniref:transposase family protein n=1 Tax=Nonomuraea sp. NPDC049400 TaxID=3364352 RepID=UPI0037B0D507
MRAHVPDPRDPRGRRHPLTVLLGLVQAAIVSGATTYAATRATASASIGSDLPRSRPERRWPAISWVVTRTTR